MHHTRQGLQSRLRTSLAKQPARQALGGQSPNLGNHTGDMSPGLGVGIPLSALVAGGYAAMPLTFSSASGEGGEESLLLGQTTEPLLGTHSSGSSTATTSTNPATSTKPSICTNSATSTIYSAASVVVLSLDPQSSSLQDSSRDDSPRAVSPPFGLNPLPLHESGSGEAPHWSAAAGSYLSRGSPSFGRSRGGKTRGTKLAQLPPPGHSTPLSKSHSPINYSGATSSPGEVTPSEGARVDLAVVAPRHMEADLHRTATDQRAYSDTISQLVTQHQEILGWVTSLRSQVVALEEKQRAQGEELHRLREELVRSQEAHEELRRIYRSPQQVNLQHEQVPAEGITEQPAVTVLAASEAITP